MTQQAPDMDKRHASAPAQPAQAQASAQVIPLRPPSRWHDPLKLIQGAPPSEFGRIVLWSIAVLVGIMMVWAAFGQLDIIATAEGKLVPQTLVKIVQPAESGVVKALLVKEGDTVKAGQVLARLDTTLATADKTGVASDLATQQLQVRRIEAELQDQPMSPKAGDDVQRFAQVHSQYIAHRKAFVDALDQEKSILTKVEHEKRSAVEILAKLEQTLPTYKKSAEAYVKLEREGFFSGLAAAEKQREAIEKAKDLDAQKAMVASLDATIAAQHKKISQLKSAYQSELQKELADIRAKIAQLQPNLDKTLYKEGLMELKAPQDGVIKDLATTTVGAVVQPGTVVLTLVPQGEELYADVNVKNEDVGFVQIGQSAQVKLAAYPFQKYGMLIGKVIHISADATESNHAANGRTDGRDQSGDAPTAGIAVYKARIKLDSQTLNGPRGSALAITPGMQIVAEINQGKRTVLEYLLSPVQKTVMEAGRER
ncbi:HlyD family type I secretion periplasmic adaptor subunit [Janthinobacterium sp. 17J80-10]|uniref:HlyD family type I secretion periplasmic adaptor subunit n=1 Tax=Janthinobacterium sp. 17J80-10 TaxID=2497863 RepID=UPI0010052A8C|nr:HlyD family type I secretion periplasmic adaptor subunit [Janthinobacterium sp. 17J80-10]QAU34867.1 HlyD family type I secretion periplasmic adaptor subunit [Janthinobacterium sp. 17J80-10]